ncbi:cation transporter [Tenacibaculum litopenaei]|uniref:cation transporter n=1 Tax=Tenacibaculum litopenaei TaxID=396016 RepID=UPI0038B56DAC
MIKSTFSIPLMDCPSEESMIRLKLQGNRQINSLQFELAERKLVVFHTGEVALIEEELRGLKLGATLINSVESDAPKNTAFDQRGLLWTVLIINALFFLVEFCYGILANSMGLVADSFDMLADSFVYGLSLLAVSKSELRQKVVAKLAGYFQVAIAVLGFAEVLRRFFFLSSIPEFKTMIVISIIALLANVSCLLLLQRSKGKEQAHMRASMIFTSNDILINTGVIFSGILVYFTNSKLPDLLIGTLVFILVLIGARRILLLSR